MTTPWVIYNILTTSFPDQSLRAPLDTAVPSQAIQTPGVTPSPILPDSVPIIDDAPSADDPLSTHNRSTITMTARKANYRPLPVKKTASKSVQDTKKRKQINKSRPIDFFQSSESEEDNPDGLSDDGSLSGDSVSDSVPAHAK